MFTFFFLVSVLSNLAFSSFDFRLEFGELPKFNSKTNSAWGSVLTDIINHEAPCDFNQYDDKVTLAHETTHGINAYIRNHLNNTGKKANGFYVLEDRYVLLKEPSIRKSKVAEFVPKSLRGMRFSTYIIGQTAWDDTPLYVWDEWVAYSNGGHAALNQVDEGLWNDGWRDAFSGQIEFCVYAIATAMAVEKYDPSYFNDNNGFIDFLQWHLERSMYTFKRGYLIPHFKLESQETYYYNMRKNPDGEELRNFVRKLFGNEWTYYVMEF